MPIVDEIQVRINIDEPGMWFTMTESAVKELAMVRGCDHLDFSTVMVNLMSLGFEFQ